MRRQETISFDKTFQHWSRLVAASHMPAHTTPDLRWIVGWTGPRTPRKPSRREETAKSRPLPDTQHGIAWLKSLAQAAETRRKLVEKGTRAPRGFEPGSLRPANGRDESNAPPQRMLTQPRPLTRIRRGVKSPVSET